MSADGTTRITDRSEILKRRSEHFNDVLNLQPTISLAALDEATRVQTQLLQKYTNTEE